MSVPPSGDTEAQRPLPPPWSTVSAFKVVPKQSTTTRTAPLPQPGLKIAIADGAVKTLIAALRALFSSRDARGLFVQDPATGATLQKPGDAFVAPTPQQVDAAVAFVLLDPGNRIKFGVTSLGNVTVLCETPLRITEGYATKFLATQQASGIVFGAERPVFVAPVVTPSLAPPVTCTRVTAPMAQNVVQPIPVRTPAVSRTPPTSCPPTGNPLAPMPIWQPPPVTASASSRPMKTAPRLRKGRRDWDDDIPAIATPNTEFSLFAEVARPEINGGLVTAYDEIIVKTCEQRIVAAGMRWTERLNANARRISHLLAVEHTERALLDTREQWLARWHQTTGVAPTTDDSFCTATLMREDAQALLPLQRIPRVAPLDTTVVRECAWALFTKFVTPTVAARVRDAATLKHDEDGAAVDIQADTYAKLGHRQRKRALVTTPSHGGASVPVLDDGAETESEPEGGIERAPPKRVATEKLVVAAAAAAADAVGVVAPVLTQYQPMVKHEAF